jgi:hypothetical protein
MTKAEEVARAIARAQLGKLPNVDLDSEVEKHWELYIAAAHGAIAAMEGPNRSLGDSLGAIRARLLLHVGTVEELRQHWNEECEADPFLAQEYDLDAEWAKLEAAWERVTDTVKIEPAS